MYHSERKRGWCEEDGTLIVHDCDLTVERHTIQEFLREREIKQMSKDTGLHTLMNFMEENNALFFYCEEKKCFALVTEHGLTDTDLAPKGSLYCSFVSPDKDCDIENEFLKPAIFALERGAG